MPSFRIILLAISAVSLFAACGERKAGDKGTDMQRSLPAVTSPVVLKNVTIDPAYLFADGENVRGIEIDETLRAIYKPQSIDEFFGEEFPYYLADTIGTSDVIKVYLVVRYDPNEISGWLVVYDAAMHVHDMIEVYYENAEGNFTIVSEIRDNIVKQTAVNIVPEEFPDTHFRLDAKMRWEVIEDYNEIQ